MHGVPRAGAKVLLDMTFSEITEHLNRQQVAQKGPLERDSELGGDDMEGLETPFRSVVSGKEAISLSAITLRRA